MFDNNISHTEVPNEFYASLTYKNSRMENKELDLESRAPGNDGIVREEMAIESFKLEKQENMLYYRVMALPLDELIVNSAPIAVRSCQTSKSVNCFEANLLAKYPLRECQTNAEFNLTYNYKDKNLYIDEKVIIPEKNYRVAFDVKCSFQILFQIFLISYSNLI